MLTNCPAACAHLSITVSEIQRDICEKSSFYHTPLAFDAPVRGVPVGISAPGPERDRLTNGQTDRHCVTVETALASHRAVKTAL